METSIDSIKTMTEPKTRKPQSVCVGGKAEASSTHIGLAALVFIAYTHTQLFYSLCGVQTISPNPWAPEWRSSLRPRMSVLEVYGSV